MATVITTLNERVPQVGAVMEGIRRFGAEVGWQVLADEASVLRADLAEAGRIADGFIVPGMTAGSHAGMLDTGRPVVGVIEVDHPDDLPRATPDLEAEAQMALDHLADQAVAVLGVFHSMDPHMPTGRMRADHLLRLAGSRGLRAEAFPNGPRTAKRWTLMNQLLDLGDWLHTLPHPVGILAGDDEHAQRACVAAERAGLAVPGQVAVVGCGNDTKTCEAAPPTISSLAPDPVALGRAAAQFLHDLMRGGSASPQTRYVPPKGVVVRATSDRRYVQYPYVLKAMQYIDANLDEAFKVTDLCDHVGVSKTYLNRRFRAATGRSTWDYVRQTRIDRATRLAESTDLSLAEIAARVGYPYPSHLSRDLSRIGGQTLRQIRAAR